MTLHPAVVGQHRCPRHFPAGRGQAPWGGNPNVKVTDSVPPGWWRRSTPTRRDPLA